MRVLISGAGIAGPTLAWFLARTGARITIVEKTHTILPHGQNIDMQGSARKVIKTMGFTDEVLRHNTTEKGTQFIDSKGKPFAPFPVRKGAASSPTSEWEILRGDLAAVLYNATKDHPNVNYLFDTTIKEVISNDDDSVQVELSNGEIQKSDLLVASDGQWSKLRKQCFPPESVQVIDKGMDVVYYTVPRLPQDNDYWNVYQALGSRIITLRPDPHGTIRAMFTRMSCNEAQEKTWSEASRSDRKTQEELLRKDFADAGWEAQRLLDAMGQAPDFYFHPMQQIKMSKWSNSRVICLGDTAFAPSSLTGMGTSLAITGAYVLAGELSKLGDGEHPSKALDAYESIFRPFVEEMQTIPSFVPDIAHPETAFKRWMFHALVSALSKAASYPWLAKRLHDDDPDDFLLPQYSTFNDEVAY